MTEIESYTDRVKSARYRSDANLARRCLDRLADEPIPYALTEKAKRAYVPAEWSDAAQRIMVCLRGRRLPTSARALSRSMRLGRGLVGRALANLEAVGFAVHVPGKGWRRV